MFPQRRHGFVTPSWRTQTVQRRTNLKLIALYIVATVLAVTGILVLPTTVPSLMIVGGMVGHAIDLGLRKPG